MSLVEDLRKLLQDVVTPDLKALEARVAALEKHVDQRFDAQDKKIDQRFDAQDKKIDLKVASLDQKIDFKHDLVMQEIRSLSAAMLAGFARMESNFNLERRIERIENERAQPLQLERTA